MMTENAKKCNQTSFYQEEFIFTLQLKSALHDIYVSLSFKSVLHSGGEVGGYQNHPGNLFKQHQPSFPTSPPSLWDPTYDVSLDLSSIICSLTNRHSYLQKGRFWHMSLLYTSIWWGGGAEIYINDIIFQLHADILKEEYVCIFRVIYSGG